VTVYVRPGCGHVDGEAVTLLDDLRLTLPRCDVGQELGVAVDAVGDEDWRSRVNSSAIVPTTRTSMTMPFRKNFGFKREPPGRADDEDRRRWAEYSVGRHPPRGGGRPTLDHGYGRSTVADGARARMKESTPGDW
jgi:hypothetical protein